MNRRLAVLLAALTLLTVTPGAFAQDSDSISLFQMFFLSKDLLGLGIIWLLLALSTVSIGYSGMLLLRYRRSSIIPDPTRDEIEALIDEKKFRDAIEYAQSDPSFLGKLCSSALSEAPNGYAAMERAVEESGDAETTRILRPVEYLNVLGNIAPMMGLFGTVYGMIVAFRDLVAAGGGADPTELAKGISTALVTTFWGLVVAIPALAAYALIRNRIDALTTEGILVAEEVISPFKPGGKKGSGGGSKPRATPKPEAPKEE